MSNQKNEKEETISSFIGYILKNKSILLKIISIISVSVSVFIYFKDMPPRLEKLESKNSIIKERLEQISIEYEQCNKNILILKDELLILKLKQQGYNSKQLQLIEELKNNNSLIKQDINNANNKNKELEDKFKKIDTDKTKSTTQWWKDILKI